MKNGQMWQDTQGRDIQAHGGCILQYADTYYWYGEHKGADNCPGTYRVDVIGISCYTSTDLKTWTYKGLVLSADQDDPDSILHPSRVVERPKVLYNEKTGQFVLWFHADTADYRFAGVGVAVSPSPTGPFALVKTFRPHWQDSRDMTLYQDADGVAYLIGAKDGNATLSVSRLNDSYTDVDGLHVSVLIDQYREAPALFYDGDRYHMITSGCTGWEPNAALVSESAHLLGPWKLVDNPCRGKDSDKTFLGQSSFIFKAGEAFYLMLDHWRAQDLKTSGYSILPITVSPKHRVTVHWQEEWNGI